MTALRILHVMRAPVGGLFRHVVDLARAQSARGHAVGIIADASTGAARAEATLDALAPSLALGVTRIAMARHLGLSDISAVKHVKALARGRQVDVVHGHGAKGGAYARLVGPGWLRVYTPHGGSLHYSRRSPVGLLYLSLERVLSSRTDLFLFESQYGLDTFCARIGTPPTTAKVVHNGVAEEEFAPISLSLDAADFVVIGELRKLKGIDVLLAACARLHAENRPVSLTVVGEGADGATLREQADRLQIASAVRFVGVKPAREALALGRVLVVPSRAESLPYVVLEAAAAGRPVIASAVGGIGEIFGPDADALVPADNIDLLADKLRAALARPDDMHRRARRLQQRVHAGFSVDVMADAVLNAYAEALQGRRGQNE